MLFPSAQTLAIPIPILTRRHSLFVLSSLIDPPWQKLLTLRQGVNISRKVFNIYVTIRLCIFPHPCSNAPSFTGVPGINDFVASNKRKWKQG